MRKQVFGRQLGRTKNQRVALFRGLICSLIAQGEIETTLAKAKSIKSQAEKLITRAKGGSLSDRRIIFRFLNKKELVNRLVDGIAPVFKERKGGYLRLIHLSQRRGDAALMAKLVFVEDISQINKTTPEQQVKEQAAEPIKEEKVIKKTTRSKKA